MEQHILQCRHLLSVSERVLDGLNDTHRALEPQPGAKTAGWLIGHLAVTGDFARKLCGRPPLCPAEWRPLFNPGSQPSHQAADYAPMQRLCDAFRLVYTDLCEHAAGTDPRLLSSVNPYPPTRAQFPTSGDFVAYMMAGHFGYHMGQLTAWRAAAGLGRLPERL